ncbi:MAG: hypothetical protein ACPGWR_10485 [Ardenticatenaceae bacterium]
MPIAGLVGWWVGGVVGWWVGGFVDQPALINLRTGLLTFAPLGLKMAG